MDETVTAALHNRLRNCLQTILELEPQIERLDMGHALTEEFGQLKAFIEKLEDVRLDEDDVERIERATEHFLAEVEAPLSQARETLPRGRLQ